MKMSLRLVFNNVEELRSALKELSSERFCSNATGKIGGVDFDYDFVDSDDLFSKDDLLTVIYPKFNN